MMDRRAPLPLHRLHDEDIERLLVSGERRAELAAQLGPRGYRELAALAKRAGETRSRGGPVVYVLPGLMGSRIGTRGRLLDDVLWLDPIEIAAGHLTRLALPRGSRLSALGVMLLNALKMKLSLTIAGFDARFHAYDWRLGVEALAAELNTRIEADGVRDVMLVGHSMGGVVARVALAAGAGRITRVVQLGAPNAGSFAAVLALRGVYVTVRKLAALDLRHDAEDLARVVFRSLPSLHELLPDPALAAGPDFFDTANWPETRCVRTPGCCSMRPPRDDAVPMSISAACTSSECARRRSRCELSAGGSGSVSATTARHVPACWRKCRAADLVRAENTGACRTTAG